MVRDHVAQRPGSLVELAAPLHADRLRHGDLHVIDPVAIPNRFEQPIGEAERHDALDRVFSQKVVDAENLVLVQRAQNTGIQLARRLEAMAEWLLDHHAAPEPRLAILVLVLIGELRFAELIHHGAKESVGDGEVEDDVAQRAVGLFCLCQRGADFLVQVGLGEVPLHVGHFSRQATSTPRRRFRRRRIPQRHFRRSFSACREGGRASSRPLPHRGPRRSTRICRAAPWCARDCRVPASLGAWSGHRRHRRSPWRRDRPDWPGAAAATRPPARSELPEFFYRA